MSLMGSLMGDLEDDPIFGHHMRSMRQMNNMMNSLFADPFGMMGGMNSMASIAGPNRNSMMPYFPQMPTMNRLLSSDLNMAPQISYSSSSVFSLSAGPDGRPQQVYQATSSTRTGPDGIRETKKTVQDSYSGTKKMAIGHHIGERSHVIEREKNYRTGEEEERQEFINLDDNEADDFNREFQHKARNLYSPGGRRHGDLLALPSNQPTQNSYISCEPRQQQLQLTNSPHNSPSTSAHSQRRSMSSSIQPRRGIRSPASSPLLLPPTTHLMSPTNNITSTSVHPHPYNVNSRKNRSNKRSTPNNYTQH